jgi:hypothetical protein
LIAEHQRIGQIITAEFPFKNLRGLAISLYLERNGEDSDYLILKAFMQKSAKLEGRRNQITHSLWAAGKDPQSITRINTTSKEKNGLQFQFEDVQAKDLSSFVSEIEQLAEGIQLFWIHHLENGKLVSNKITL